MGTIAPWVDLALDLRRIRVHRQMTVNTTYTTSAPRLRPLWGFASYRRSFFATPMHDGMSNPRKKGVKDFAAAALVAVLSRALPPIRRNASRDRW